MTAARLLTAVAFGLALSACGTSSPPSSKAPVPGSPNALERQVRAHLVAAGYQPGGEVADVLLRPRPGATLAVRDVDFASRHTFSVAIYFFRSHQLASRFDTDAEHRLAADVSVKFAPKSRSEYGFRVVGRRVYFGFTSMNPTLCVPFGLCASFKFYGPIPSCDGSRTCTGSGPPPLPDRDFDGLVRAT